LNVERAWLQGLTGCNVTVGIVDDGKTVRELMISDQTSYVIVVTFHRY